MLILTIRTDKPESEIGLFNGKEQLAYMSWQAHRQLAETIHIKLKELLDSQHFSLRQLEGIIVFQGPGSFTGLRIGLSVANALADSRQIPIVATSGEAWIGDGVTRLQKNESDEIALPNYGAPPRTTKPKH